MLGVWPVLVVCGGSFAVVQFLVSNLHGPTLVDVIGGLVSLFATALFLLVWKPKKIWHFPEEPPSQPPMRCRTREIISAWVPWMLLTVFVFVWGLPPVKRFLNETTLKFEVPLLHNRVAEAPPVVLAPKPKSRVRFQLAQPPARESCWRRCARPFDARPPVKSFVLCNLAAG